jgi:transcriptional regulator with XRE-family HTH domain
MTQAPETLGQYIRRLREAQNLAAQDVVNATGVSNATVSFYESGRSLPSPPLLEKVVAFLGGDFDYAWALWLIRAGVKNVTVPTPNDGLPVQPSFPLEVE